ncbi:MAG: glycosyltransferase family 4 protein [Holophagaceae bacterium]|nr:glycosyltransferase family 4 protein [Holophagaceae bacterium]
MKLGLFHPAFKTLGGAEILAASHGRFLLEEGHELSIITFGYDPDRWGDRLAGMDLRLVPKRHWRDAFLFWDRLRKQRARGLRAEPQLKGFDAVIAYNWPCSTMLGASATGARKIWHCNEPPRGLHPRAANPTLVAKLQEGERDADALKAFARRLAASDRKVAGNGTYRSLREADLKAIDGLDELWALSEFSAANLCAAYGPRKVEVIYPMVRFPEGVAKQRGLDRSGLQVLVHSRLEVLKNVDTVLKGFAQFRTKADPSARLHVVGEGESRPRLESLSRELGLERSVVFHGFLPDEGLREVYDACDVFALLTLDEPFGMVYPEAAAKGLLLIGPDHGGPFEILEGGRIGWCVDAFDPSALCGALEEIRSLPDAEVMRRRAEADRACRMRFGRTAIGARLLQLLRA